MVGVAAPDALVVALWRRHEHALRLDLADHPADVAAQLQARHELAVGIAEKPDVVNPDPLGRLGLLGAAHAGDLVAREVEVEAAGVAVGADAVDDLDAGVRPGRDGPGRAEVDVVRVRGDDERALNFFVGHRCGGHARHLTGAVRPGP